MQPLRERIHDVPTLSERIQYGGLRALEWGLGRLGVDRASAFSGWCWRQIGPLTRRHLRVTYQLRMIFPAADDAWIERVGRAVWTNLGRVFAESLLLDVIVADPARIDLSGAEELIATARGGQAVAMGMPHMGNWEIAALAAYKAGMPAAGVYKRLSNPLVERWLYDRRSRYFSAPLVDATERRTAVAGLLRALKGGASVAMIVDLHERYGQPLDFLGHAAQCVDFPAMVARMMDLPLFAVRIVRTDGVHFRVEAERIPVPRGDDHKADIATANAALHDRLGRWIVADPEQWFWIHLRWLESRAALRRRTGRRRKRKKKPTPENVAQSGSGKPAPEKPEPETSAPEKPTPEKPEPEKPAPEKKV